MVEGLNIQQIDDLLELFDALLAPGLLSGANEILDKVSLAPN